jgi:hypothetical protein
VRGYLREATADTGFLGEEEAATIAVAPSLINQIILLIQIR